MTNGIDAQGKLLPDKDRLIKVGRLIRPTSMVEIPQLFNVLKGDMSLIGPVRCCQNTSPFTTNNSHAGMKFARHHRMGADQWTQRH